MQRFVTRHLATIILCAIGLIFLAAGLAIGIFGTRAATDAAARAEALAPLTPTRVGSLTPGDEILIEGVLSQRNRQGFRNYVAYVREEYQGSDRDGDDNWAEDERVTPRLLVELGKGGGAPVQIGNTDYRIEQPHEIWQDGEFAVYNGVSSENTKRYEGMLAGRAMMAIGKVQAGSEGPELRAEFMYGGTRAEYIAKQQAVAGWLPWFGLAIAAVGLTLVAIGVVVVLRGAQGRRR